MSYFIAKSPSLSRTSPTVKNFNFKFKGYGDNQTPTAPKARPISAEDRNGNSTYFPQALIPQGADILKANAKFLPSAYDQFEKNSDIIGGILTPLLNDDAKQAVQDIADHKRSVVVLGNMPIAINPDKLINTPGKLTKRPQKEDELSESLLLGVANLMGGIPKVTMDSETGERVKEAITQIAPVDKKSDTGAGSKIGYSMHTEAASAVNPPDNFALLALRGDKNAKTVYMPVKKILKELDEETITALRQKEFRFNPKNGKGELIAPILTLNENSEYQIRLNLADKRIDPMTENAASALNTLRNKLANDPDIPGEHLQAGQMILIDNRSTLHGRSPFEISTPKGQERWLQRGYFSSKTKKFDINKNLFKDKKGRNCHEIIPRNKIYNDVTDFSTNATKDEKLQLLDNVMLLSKNARGYRFCMDNDPKTDKLRIYVATTHKSSFRDSRWEERGIKHKGNMTAWNNNPLHEKALPYLKTTKSISKNFITFPSLKANHDLITPRQDKAKPNNVGYKDLNDFHARASDDEKVELFDMIAQNAEKGNKVYVNCGVSRHIPYLHVHLLRGDYNAGRSL